MRRTFILMTCLAMIAWSSVVVRAKVKKVPYTKIDVNIEEAYTPDAAFQAMSKSFGEAAARKDSPALFALVGPTFIWMSQGAPAEAFDMGRDALHNFKSCSVSARWARTPMAECGTGPSGSCWPPSPRMEPIT